MTPATHPIPAAANLPDEMLQADRWITWKYGERDGRLTKIPTNPWNGGYQSGVNNPEIRATFEEAVAGARAQGAGVGFVLGDGLYGVDLDHCIAEDGTIHRHAQAIIDRLASYTERSVSATGVHIIVKAALLGHTTRQKKDLPEHMAGLERVEMFNGDRYFTVTGNLIGSTANVEDRQAEIQRLHREVFPDGDEPTNQTERKPVPLSDDEIMQRIRESKETEKFAKLWAGDIADYGSNRSVADLALCGILAFWLDCDLERMDAWFRRSGLIREKWDKIADVKGRTYGQRTLAKAVAGKTETFQPGGTKKISPVAELLAICKELGFEYFHSGLMRTPYVRALVGKHHQCHKVVIKGGRVREMLIRAYRDAKGVAPPREALNSVMETILSDALGGKHEDVSIRFARSADKVWLDLCDGHGGVVEITGTGWRVVQDPDVLFERPDGAGALPIPVQGGSISELRTLINAQDDRDWKLIVGWLIGVFQPSGSFCHLSIEGSKGSVKTCTCLVLRDLVDPQIQGKDGVRSLAMPPKNEVDVTIAALYCGVLGYDNLSGISARISDLFCQLSTGGTYKTRTLYDTIGLTDVSVRIPLLVNGIDSIATRGDLLDRTIVVDLKPLEDGKRIREQVLWERFEAARPKLLGALLDIVAYGLKNRANVAGVDVRMADFATWVSACEGGIIESLSSDGWATGDFMAAYRGRREEAEQTLVENDQIASAMVSWVQQNLEMNESHALTTKGWLNELNLVTAGERLDFKEWPASPVKLGKQFGRIGPLLAAHGIELEKRERITAGMPWNVRLLVESDRVRERREQEEGVATMRRRLAKQLPLAA